MVDPRGWQGELTTVVVDAREASFDVDPGFERFTDLCVGQLNDTTDVVSRW